MRIVVTGRRSRQLIEGLVHGRTTQHQVWKYRFSVSDDNSNQTLAFLVCYLNSLRWPDHLIACEDTGAAGTDFTVTRLITAQKSLMCGQYLGNSPARNSRRRRSRCTHWNRQRRGGRCSEMDRPDCRRLTCACLHVGGTVGNNSSATLMPEEYTKITRAIDQ